MSKIIQSILLVVACIGQMLVLQAQTSNQQMPLVALATQQKYNVPILYAAVYAKRTESGKPLFNSENAFRMESRYIIDKFSKRRNHKLWMELTMINSSKAELNNFSSELLAFSKLMKMDMYKGDRLVFDYHPDNGTEIILNDVLLKSFKNTQFQNILTAIWFGNRPPSVIFAKQLNREPNAKSLNAFRKMEYSSQRKNQIDTLQAKVVDNQKTKAAEKKTPIKQVPSQKKKVAKVTSPQEKTQKVRAKKNIIKKPVEIARAAPPVVTDTPKEANQLSAVDEIISSLKDEYVKDVKEYIESKARPVPPRKSRKKPKDTANILVSIIEANGRVEVVDSKIIAGSFTASIQQVLFDSIRKLKQIPRMPTPINDQKLTVTVELDFSKCKRSTSAWLCF